MLGLCLAGESLHVVPLLSQAGISHFLISMAKGSPQLNWAGENEEEDRRTSTLQKPERLLER